MINFTPIYQNHSGPYSLLLLRLKDGKPYTDTSPGSPRAESVHDRALELLDEDSVDSVYVFAAAGYFTGALYKKGEQYAPLDFARARVTPPVVAAPGAPEAAPVAPVDIPPPPRVQRTTGSRFPAMRGQGLELTPGMDAKWPPSAPAQVVRKYFEDQGAGFVATAPEVVTQIGDALKAIGVEFPTSLISRLKQKGLLRKVSHGGDADDEATVSTQGE